jgi:hypothetical protein
MRRGGTFRQIILVLLTAVAAIWAGRALRDAVDHSNAPTPAPSVIEAAPTASP